MLAGMIDDRHRELGAVLSYLVGRQLRASELIEALGVSRSAYYVQRDEGRLVTADNLLRLAVALDLNPVDLLLRYGMISQEAVIESAHELQGSAPLPQRASRLRSRPKRLRPRLDAPPF